ncbi:PREDICTED: rap1 GTPase-GDP dissociation stimulator 1-B isoform X2 [Polistes dominula]|uniref:Rap1 GTPase-GDP dissociation stimulator 1-B isoform X2 n=1 Tax=Polistes dominula TaxID=743375 RepID=A0ABM1I8P8_POLDO|nr:PREDICTED: rap1 GTPase-GDP dissociation stimulator 1-B isoform X2 [Polistes dominula]
MDKSKEIIAQTAKAIAEMTKTDKGREQYTNTDIVETLMKLLKEDDINILIQTSRALGNICYENKNGKVMIKEKDGLKYILQILKKATDLKNTESADMLRRVASGLLWNFLVDQESLQQQALEENIVQILCNILEIDGAMAGETITHVLLTLGVLNDANVTFLDKRLIDIVVNILSNSKSLEISEMCLELLYDQADNDEVKLLLTKANIPELLLKLIETHGPQCTSEETRSVLKVACNLIILILTGDDSMNILYDNGKGTVYNNFVKWLNSNDEDFQVTAVLAMGNFARTHNHCKLMVEQDIHKKLLQLIQKNDSKNSDIRFQHALLSALHNLVIPTDNKPIILKDGLIDILYPMLDIPTFPIVFKLLGTLRIVIDRQKEAAISLGKKEDLIKRTVVWCGTDDHPGVQGEANRLLAWLINNSKDKDVALVIIKYGGTQYLIKMILAEHALMQNEAILSLTYLATICPIELEDVLIKNNIGDVICKFLKESASNLELPIICNMFSFIDSIIKSDIIRQHLNNTKGLKTTLKNVLDYEKVDSTLKEKINVIWNTIDADSSLN